MLAAEDLEAAKLELLLDRGRVGAQPVEGRLSGFQDVDRCARSGGERWRQRGRHHVRRCLLAQPVDYLALTRDEAAAATTEGLAERAGDDVDARDHAAQLPRAAPGLAEHADAERVVEHYHRSIFFSEAADA